MAAAERRPDEPRRGIGRMKGSASRAAELRRGLAAIGSIGEEAARRLENTMRELRSTWRRPTQPS